ncbi:MAG: Nitrilase/cyanide hydratase and apolipoprotein N-acyltransferase, partial [uncultured Gemmatimonadaceae bacterium]
CPTSRRLAPPSVSRLCRPRSRPTWTPASRALSRSHVRQPTRARRWSSSRRRGCRATQRGSTSAATWRSGITRRSRPSTLAWPPRAWWCRDRRATRSPTRRAPAASRSSSAWSSASMRDRVRARSTTRSCPSGPTAGCT